MFLNFNFLTFLASFRLMEEANRKENCDWGHDDPGRRHLEGIVPAGMTVRFADADRPDADNHSGKNWYNSHQT